MMKRTTATAEAMTPLWTTEDVAAYFGVPVATIYRWNYRHEGPPYKRVGKFARYGAEDVREWYANQPDGSGAA